MTHRKRRRSSEESRHPHLGEEGHAVEPSVRGLEVVVKADSSGTLDAVSAALSELAPEGAQIVPIERAVGDVSKSDLNMALTGSHLVIGFDVGAMPKVEEFAKEHGVEIRLYDVIYDLTRDLEAIARSLLPEAPQEQALGQARVIALFKSSRKGIILGCEVLHGRIAVGLRFRVIAAAGPVYTGVVESLRVGANPVKEVRTGQQVGLKIRDFNRAEIGHLVECFEATRPTTQPWSPRPGVHRATR